MQKKNQLSSRFDENDIAAHAEAIRERSTEKVTLQPGVLMRAKGPLLGRGAVPIESAALLRTQQIMTRIRFDCTVKKHMFKGRCLHGDIIEVVEGSGR